MVRRILAIVLTIVMVMVISPLVFATEVASSAQIPEDAVEFNGHFYKIFVDSEMGWHDAKLFCENLGGHLATATSKEENVFIYSLVSDYSFSFWLGATDEDDEGAWMWVTDEQWDYFEGGFDNCKGLQHYLVINYRNSQGWDDQSEKDTSMNGQLCNAGGFVCEWDDGTLDAISYRETYGWCLTNNSVSYGYDDDYRIPMSQYYKVYGISLTTLMESSLSSIPKWNGSCFGMSLLSLAQYYNLVDISPYFSNSGAYLYDFGYDSIYTDEQGNECFSISKLNNQAAVNMIERAHISQDSAEFARCEILQNDSDFSKLIEYMSGDDAKPIMVTFRSGFSGHAMVLTTDIKPTPLSGEYSGWFCFSTYDPNAPANSDLLGNPMHYYQRGDSFLLVNPSTGEWRYLLDGEVRESDTYYTFNNLLMPGNIVGKSIWYYDVSSLDSSYFTEMLNLWYQHIQLRIFGDNTTICDNNGNVLLELKDDKVVTISDECSIKTHFDSNENGSSYVFYTDIPNLSISSNSATVLALDDEYIVSAELNDSYRVDIDFNTQEVFATGLNTGGKFSICAQDYQTQAIKLTGENISGNSVSISLQSDDVRITSGDNGVNLTCECENVDWDDVQINMPFEEEPPEEIPSEESTTTDNQANDNISINTTIPSTALEQETDEKIDDDEKNLGNILVIVLLLTVGAALVVIIIIVIFSRRSKKKQGVSESISSNGCLVCSNCGTSNKMDTNYCRMCGTHLRVK